MHRYLDSSLDGEFNSLKKIKVSCDHMGGNVVTKVRRDSMMAVTGHDFRG